VAADRYDTVIVGGAALGSATAYFLGENPDYDGRVLVVEVDPTYARSSTALSAASIRHQFSNPVNVALSQFGTEFIRDFRARVEVDGQAPDVGFRETGYLFLATAAGMPALERNHEVQTACGADVSLLDTAQLNRRFPYLNTSDLAGGSVGESGEGTLDAHSLMQGFRQRARHNGVEYLTDRVVGFDLGPEGIAAVMLASGRRVTTRTVVNAAGPRARWVAQMAGLDLPVEPRARSVFVFDCRTPIDELFPLTIDTSGIWVRTEPPHFMAGCSPVPDIEVDPDDFTVRRDLFDSRIWPALAHRIPQFDEIVVTHSWAGHYAFNTLDHNAVIGAGQQVPNFLFANGFSGHGMQQAAGVGRGISELICHGEYRTLDLSPLGYDRIVRGEPFMEDVIIS
jgi:glycine/D-amino acid oxidase-like deaminating enzyme